jgi:hypothetical protein
MADRLRPMASQVLLWSAGAIFVAVGASRAWRLHESAELIRLGRPLQRSPVQPSLRLLSVGDSAAVGTDATTPEASIAGLLGRQFPLLQSRTGHATARSLPIFLSNSMPTSASTSCW